MNVFVGSFLGSKKSSFRVFLCLLLPFNCARDALLILWAALLVEYYDPFVEYHFIFWALIMSHNSIIIAIGYVRVVVLSLLLFL